MTTRYRLWLFWLGIAACLGCVLAVQLGARGLLLAPIVIVALDSAGYLALRPRGEAACAQQPSASRHRWPR